MRLPSPLPVLPVIVAAALGTVTASAVAIASENGTGSPVRAAALADVRPAPSIATPSAPLPDDVVWRDGLHAGDPIPMPEAPAYVTADDERVTVERVAAFLRAKDSPLTPFAEDFVAAGVAHEVDPRVVVAIAGIESSFGARQLGHNAWGWGGSNLVRWPDWPTAIDAYTEALGEAYDTSNIDESFAQTYVPPNWRHWLSAVHQFMAEM